MLKAFPIPPNADTVSAKAIKHFEEKLGNTTITREEIQFIIDGVMKAQTPRDQERASTAEEKRLEREIRRKAVAEIRKSRH